MNLKKSEDIFRTVEECHHLLQVKLQTFPENVIKIFTSAHTFLNYVANYVATQPDGISTVLQGRNT